MKKSVILEILKILWKIDEKSVIFRNTQNLVKLSWKIDGKSVILEVLKIVKLFFTNISTKVC